MAVQLHGGDIYEGGIRYDFSVNINPLGLPEPVKTRLADSLQSGIWEHYPDPKCRELTGLLAGNCGLDPDWILCGNGAAELIDLLVRAASPRTALIPVPTFSEYERALVRSSCRIRQFPLKEEADFRTDMATLAAQITDDLDMVFFCNPNNPTGAATTSEELTKLAEACREHDVWLVIDECFCQLADQEECCSMVKYLAEYPKLLILRAFTKTYAMAGLRLGYVLCQNQELLKTMVRLRQPWSVSIPAQEAGCAALACTDYLTRSRRLIQEERRYLEQGLKGLGCRVYPSECNFLLFSPTGQTVDSLSEQLQKQGILIRSCESFTGLGAGYYRIGVRTHAENMVFLSELEKLLSPVMRGAQSVLNSQRKA